MIRIFTVLLALTLGACGGSPETASSSPAAADPQKIYKWRLVTTWPKNLPGLGTAPERMADNIRVMSNGRLDIRVYGAGEVVPPLEVFEAVSQGTVQMGHEQPITGKAKSRSPSFLPQYLLV